MILDYKAQAYQSRSGQVYELKDLPAIITYLEKVISQNENLGREIQKLLDERIKLEKRLEFYKSIVNIRGIG